MEAILLDAGSPESCHPLCATRPLAACRVADTTLGEAQKRRLAGAGFALPAAPRPGALALFLPGDSWPSRDLLERLALVTAPCVVRDVAGGVLAWVGTALEPPAGAPSFPPSDASLRIRYPWDVLRIHEELLSALTEDRIRGDLSSAAHVEGYLILGEGSRILPGVFIEGNVVIGAGCKIGPNAYLRGCTTIGDRCHIGQAVEIKNSIILDETSIGHLSYCGDSIIGARVNLGAGTITANFRHDGKSHRSTVLGHLINTGRRKFGTIIGDGVHTGVHTSIYPGRKLWPGTSTRPGAVVDHDLLTE